MVQHKQKLENVGVLKATIGQFILETDAGQGFGLDEKFCGHFPNMLS